MKDSSLILLTHQVTLRLYALVYCSILQYIFVYSSIFLYTPVYFCILQYISVFASALVFTLGIASIVCLVPLTDDVLSFGGCGQ